MAKINGKRARSMPWCSINPLGYGIIDAEFDDAANDNPITHHTLDYLQPHYRVLEPLTG